MQERFVSPLLVAVILIALVVLTTCRDNTTKRELEIARDAIETQKRINGADVAGGDDDEWLCRRAGKRACGP